MHDRSKRSHEAHASPPDAKPAARPSSWIVGLGIVWLAVVTLGVSVLWEYSLAAGAPATAPVTWPRGTGLTRVEGRAALVVLAHPRCPCTRATLTELAEIMRHASDRVTAHVLFAMPARFDADWQHTDLWQSAAAIPGVAVMSDIGGAEARRFGSLTSGQVLLYGEDDRLAFAGGITGARGHVGANTGAAAVHSLIARRPAERSRTPVFGCELFGGGDAS